MIKSTLFARIFSAVFYGITSVIIVIANKILLTNFRFPSFQVVALGQMLATIVILRAAKALKIIKFPDLDSSIPNKIFPLPLLYGINVVSGLGGTQMLNLPMFTVLRRFSIFITMILEYCILGIVATKAVSLSVSLMILGSIVAAYYDLTFDAYGYTLVTVNNVCTAALGVYTKKKLDAKDLGKYGLMYYNCLFIFMPFLTLCIYSGELDKTLIFINSDEMTTSVWLAFLLSCVCGFILNYSLVLCTQCNSALTTQCIGPIKNLFVTYFGMFSSDDFIFQWLNVVGINISIIYTVVTFQSPKLTPILPLPSKSEKQPIM